MRCLLWHCRRMRRSDICLFLGPADRTELQALIANRKTPRKLVWLEVRVPGSSGQAFR